MKLLLTSEGLTTEGIQQKFLDLVGREAHEIKVAFIPTAAEAEEDTSWVEFNKQPLINIGVKTIDDIDIREYGGAALYDVLKEYDVIWVNGGNTFYLLYWMRRSGFQETIRKLLAEGKTYVGVSAGTIVACPTIDVAGWEGMDDRSKVTLDTLEGLSLVPFHVFVHFSPERQALIDSHRNDFPGRLLALTDEQAIVINQLPKES